MKRLVILGAGGFGRTVADLARQSRCHEGVFHLDDRAGEGVLGALTQFADFADGDTEMIPAFGNNALRLDWCRKIRAAGIPLATLVHGRAYVSPTAMVGAGCILLPMSLVNTGTRLGEGCIINCGALIDHGCVIEDGCHICLGAIVKAENRIASLTKIEAGQLIEARTFPVS